MGKPADKAESVRAQLTIRLDKALIKKKIKIAALEDDGELQEVGEELFENWLKSRPRGRTK